MAKPMPIIFVPLDCGHKIEMEQWVSGDRKIDCPECGRVWILTATKQYVPTYQTKTEIVDYQFNADT